MSIIKSFSVGEGDMFYIQHNSDNFTVIDCCYDEEDSRDKHFEEIKSKSENVGITHFISTHPDEDHIKGLPEFSNTVGVSNFYCVQNEATKPDETNSFKKYCELRDSSKAFYLYKGCSRKWMNQTDETRGSAGLSCLWPITSDSDFCDALQAAKDGEAYNNISPIIKYSVSSNITALWMGDMEHDFLEKVKDKIEWPQIDLLFAPHHGRSSGRVSTDVLKELDPFIVVIGEAPSKYLDYYQGYNTITQNSAGDIVFKCTDSKVHVYCSNDSYNVSFLDNEEMYDVSLGHYLGTFTPKGAV